MDHNMNDKRKYDYFDKYTFLCEMYDEDIDDIKELILNFFPYDESVQVLDPQRGKVLVKRVHSPGLSKNKLLIGNIVNIFSKLLLLKDCAPNTRQLLFSNVQSTFALIKPVPPILHGKIITFIMKKGFQIKQIKNGKLDKDLAMEMYKEIAGNKQMPVIIEYVTSNEVIGLELVAENAVKKWRACLGATDPKQAAPGTLRHYLGKDKLRNVAHGCDDEEQAKNMIQKFFGYENGKLIVPYRATCKNCTCCVLKPHVLIDGNVGAVLEAIATSKYFYISAMATFSVDYIDAQEFYEIYKGVLPEYMDMCIQLAEGRCIALEIKSKDPSINVVCEFRKLCGPRDPDFCRQLYPECIRGMYGKNIVQNAVHCTDLPEDGELEVEYFFKILANKSLMK